MSVNIGQGHNYFLEGIIVRILCTNLNSLYFYGNKNILDLTRPAVPKMGSAIGTQELRSFYQKKFNNITIIIVI